MQNFNQKDSALTVRARSCCRCGAVFNTSGNARVCLACRHPHQHKSEVLLHLTFRESQIVTLVSQAKLNKEIAHQLHLTEGTVKEYLNKIFRKLGVTNRTELAVWSLSRPVRGPARSSSSDSGDNKLGAGPALSAPSRPINLLQR